MTGCDPLRASDGTERRRRSPATRPGGERPAPPAARARGRWRPVSRRRLVRAGAAGAGAVPLLASRSSGALARASLPAAPSGGGGPRARVRPGDPAWPPAASWDRLRRAVEGRLVEVRSPLAACAAAPSDPDCARLFDQLKNPYYLGDEVGLTQTLGWVDAWTSRPSAYAVAARTTADVVAAVELRPRAPAAPGRQGRRPQLPGHLERAGLPADLDAGDGRRHRARRLRPRRLRGTAGAAAGRHGRGRGALGAGLRRRHDAGGPLRPGRRLPDGGRRRAGPERRLRQLLQGLRDGRGRPAGGRGGHRRRRRADRQRLHPPGPLLGAQGRRRGEPGRRHPAHPAHAPPADAGALRGGLRAPSGPPPTRPSGA